MSAAHPGYPDADAQAGEEPAYGEHLPACPVLVDPRATDLDCRCWPWMDAQLEQLDTYVPAENDALDAKARRLCEAHQAGSPTRIPCAACVQDATAENDRPAEWVPWECPRCGKTAQANLTALGPLGLVRCTCGSASRPIPPGQRNAR